MKESEPLQVVLELILDSIQDYLFGLVIGAKIYMHSNDTYMMQFKQYKKAQII